MKKFFKEHDLTKALLIMICLIVLLTWIIPVEQFGTDGVLTNNGTFGRLGLVHIVYAFIFAIQNYSIQLGFLAAVGAFYGIVTHIDTYKALVNRIAKFFKGKEIVLSLIVSILFAILGTILNSHIAIVGIIPFVYAILRKTGFDKLSSLSTTVASTMLGVIGSTVGGEEIVNYVKYVRYAGAEITTTQDLLIRVLILGLAIAIFNFFNIMYIKKHIGGKNNKKAELETEEAPFVVDEAKKNKKVWPAAIMMGLVFIFLILGFTPWNINGAEDTVFGITAFEKLHEAVIGLKIGDLEIFHALMGAPTQNVTYSLAYEFGNWYTFDYAVVMLLIATVSAVLARIKFNDFIDYIIDGLKKISKPAMIMVISYMIFVFLYWSPILTTVIGTIAKLSQTTLNPFVLTLEAFVGAFFNSDLGFLAYSTSSHLAAISGSQSTIMTIMVSIFGLVKFITPASELLVFGLSYAKVPYKTWLGYIWKFFVAMLICLLIVFTILAYV